MNPKRLEKFFGNVSARLATGEREYSGQSFGKSPEELRQEVREEIEDICGWAFILWCRVQDLEG